MSILFIARLSQVVTDGPEEYVLLLAGYLFAIIPFIAGVLLFAVTISVTVLNGKPFYNKKLAVWRLVEQLNGTYRARIHWCEINLKMMGAMALIALFSSIVISFGFAPRYDAAFEWSVIPKVLLAIVAFGIPLVGPFLLVARWTNRNPEKFKLGMACLIAYCTIGFAGVAYAPDHNLHRALIIAGAVLSVPVTAFVMGCLAIATNDFFQRLGDTFLGRWVGNVCPTIAPLP